nr:hypothetical protein 9 [bacterium]
MAFSDTSRSQLFYAEESTWGVTPAVALNAFRFTGESLGLGIDTATSDEIRSDRQITDLVQTDAEPSGGVNFELSHGSIDDFLEGVLFNEWSTPVAISATDIAVDGTGQKFTSTTTDFLSENISVGQWVKVSGFTDPANNGYFQVTALATDEITVSGETALITESAGDTVAFAGTSITNGTTKKSYSLEVLFADVAKYRAFTGMLINSMELGLSVGEILKGSFNFTGKDMALSDATIGTGQPVDAPTNDVLNAINNVAYVGEGGSEFTGSIKDFSLSINNSLRSQKAIGTLGNVGIGAGRFELTGSLTSYFENADTYNKYLNGTETSLSLRLSDASGNSYILTLPRIKFTGGSLNADSADSDVMAELEYQAIRDPNTGFTFQIDKFGS